MVWFLWVSVSCMWFGVYGILFLLCCMWNLVCGMWYVVYLVSGGEGHLDNNLDFLHVMN